MDEGERYTRLDDGRAARDHGDRARQRTPWSAIRRWSTRATLSRCRSSIRRRRRASARRAGVRRLLAHCLSRPHARPRAALAKDMRPRRAEGRCHPRGARPHVPRRLVAHGGRTISRARVDAGPQPLHAHRAGDRAPRGRPSSPSARRWRRSCAAASRLSRTPVDDVQAQLARLLAPGWLAAHPLGAAAARAALSEGRGAAPGQAARRPAARRSASPPNWRAGAALPTRGERELRNGADGTELEQFGWLLEELRVSLFAQELKHAGAGVGEAPGEALAELCADERRALAPLTAPPMCCIRACSG